MRLSTAACLLWCLVGTTATLDARAASVRPLLCPQGAKPRTVVFAFDGIPFEVAAEAHARGDFGAWPAPVPLVSTFPSLTNVAFAAMFEPLGVEPIAGYEVPHFDWDRNRMVGKSPFRIKDSAYGWRDVLPSEVGGLWKHFVGYAAPRRAALRQLDEAVEAILTSEDDPLVVYVAGSDSLTHFSGYGATLSVLQIAAERLQATGERVHAATGSCLRWVLVSDHGNTREKVRRMRGFRRHLKRSGFRPKRRLEAPRDVVATTFGLVNFGVLYAVRESARQLAEATASHRDVEIAAYRAGERRVRVLAADGEAVIRWKGTGDLRRFFYEAEREDPLELSAARSALEKAGDLDAEGFAPAAVWLRENAAARFPGALERLVDALVGAYVEHEGTVVFSTVPGRAWGRKAGFLGAWLRGGLLEGTHGGLDRESTLGFLMTNDPELAASWPEAVDVADALSFLSPGGALDAETR